ncbi:MAG: putative sulfate exporter family transporter [Clostridiales bacterium]|nr:putative sulfate exporter family transporter [Clostridiales bacterium]
MQSVAKRYVSYLPGIALALVIAAISRFIEGLLPIHIIGAAVIAMFIGMGINALWLPTRAFKPGLTFTSKKLLKFAIILLGASLSIGVILNVGKLSLLVMLFTLLTCFGGGYFIGKALGLNWKLSNLISAGTGICGGSAIAAIAPTIDAKDTDIAYAMSATFLFDMAMIILFPIMGRAMGLTDMAYGLWAGTAVNDTSSVVAAGFAFSEAAGDFATMVKLTRTLSIIPTVLVFAFINVRIKRKEALAAGSTQDIKANVSVGKLFPWFIVGFLAMSLIKSVGLIPDSVSNILKDVSKFLMVAALAAIGLNTSFKEMSKSGIAPMLHGFIISALVVIVAIAVEYVMHLIGWLQLFV